MADFQGSKKLIRAKKNKNDEFFTRIEDIEAEVWHYAPCFKDKVVYCNADDFETSNFVKFFVLNFKELGLKALISSCYKNPQTSIWDTYRKPAPSYLMFDGHIHTGELSGDGSFNSKSTSFLLSQSDIIVTNPPFSVFREYMKHLLSFNKKFLLVAPLFALAYKNVLPLLRENKAWAGFNKRSMFFQTSDNKLTKLSNVCWFTNLGSCSAKPLSLKKDWKIGDFLKLRDFDGININKLSDIPEGFDGLMAVPLTYLMYHCPEQFDIIGDACSPWVIPSDNSLIINQIPPPQDIPESPCQKTKLRQSFKRVLIKKKARQ